MSTLYIIRHAPVRIDPSTPAPQWGLSEEGRLASARLAAGEKWKNLHTIWHSPEPKAEQTAQVIAAHANVSLKMHPALAELEMNAGFLAPDVFQQRVAHYLQGAADADFEPYETAQNRIVSAVQDIVAQADGQSVALVSHGRILTVFYSWLFGRRLGPDEWKSIRLPDLSVIDTKNWAVQRGFLADIEEKRKCSR